MKSPLHRRTEDRPKGVRIGRAMAPALAALLVAAPLAASPAYAAGPASASGTVAAGNGHGNHNGNGHGNGNGPGNGNGHGNGGGNGHGNGNGGGHGNGNGPGNGNGGGNGHGNGNGHGSQDPVKKVTGGVIRGSVDDDGVQAYKGIPYAASTAGENRWRAPQPVSWKGVKDATKYGPITVQNPAFGAFGPWTPEYLDTNMTLENGLMSEDSLNLNVWTTEKPNAGKPVIVYIHGGGNQSGSGQNEIYSGEEISQKDVVYVSINYRVGIFGYLAYKDATGAEITGNFAQQDQIAALKWVQDNIRAFGGDPGNVTIAGQSAGSSNVQTLVASPAAAGLFDGAVAMSSNSINRPATALATAQERATQAFGEYTLDQLRAMSAAEVQALTARYNPTSAVVDGSIVTQSLTDAYLNGTANPVDLMIGNVDGDGGPLRLPDDNAEPYDRVGSVTPAAYTEAVTTQLGAQFLDLYPVDPNATNVIETARELNSDGMVTGAARHADVREANYADENSYLYQFSHIVPDTPERMEAFGAFHTGDVGYWTNYFSDTWNRPWTDVDFALGDLMSSYLVDFANDGTVDGWPAYEPGQSVVEYMHFDDVSGVDTLDEAKTAAWKDYWTP